VGRQRLDHLALGRNKLAKQELRNASKPRSLRGKVRLHALSSHRSVCDEYRVEMRPEEARMAQIFNPIELVVRL
jgi:hypothetical protein